MNFENIVSELLKNIPEFNNSTDFKDVEYQQDLPYVIFGALQLFYVRCYQNGEIELIKKISNFLEKVSRLGDVKLEELVAYGFLENMDHQAPNYKDLISYFGKNTAKLLADVHKFWGVEQK